MIFLPSEAPCDDLQDMAVIWVINLELGVLEEGIFLYAWNQPSHCLSGCKWEYNACNYEIALLN